MKKRQSKESRATPLAARSTKLTLSEDDLHPDARERFERAVDIAVATKPIHRPAKPKRKVAG